MDTELIRQVAHENARRLRGHVARYHALLSIEGYSPAAQLTAGLATVAMTMPDTADALAEAARAIIGQGTPAGRFTAAAQARAKQDDIPLTKAYHLVAHEQPELYLAYRRGGRRGG